MAPTSTLPTMYSVLQETDDMSTYPSPETPHIILEGAIQIVLDKGIHYRVHIFARNRKKLSSRFVEEIFAID